MSWCRGVSNTPGFGEVLLGFIGSGFSLVLWCPRRKPSILGALSWRRRELGVELPAFGFDEVLGTLFGHRWIPNR